MEEISLYKRITDAMDAEGNLPDGFMLRGEPANLKGKLFADGAIDGTIRYFMGPVENADVSGLSVVLTTASNGQFKDAVNALLTHFMNGGTMLPVMDALQGWIYDNPDKLNPAELGRFCRTLLTESTDVESVKFALTVLELLEQENDDELRDIILTLAKSDELTLFCLFQMVQWDDGMEQVYKLAKSMKGWGRIHAVSMLKPVSEEIADWLLYEGWHNEVADEYSAMTIIKRCKVADKLSADKVSEKFLQNATRLIGCALEDSAVAGVRSYKRGEELLNKYLNHVDKMKAAVAGWSEADRQLVEDIKAVLAELRKLN